MASVSLSGHPIQGPSWECRSSVSDNGAAVGSDHPMSRNVDGCRNALDHSCGCAPSRRCDAAFSDESTCVRRLAFCSSISCSYSSMEKFW